MESIILRRVEKKMMVGTGHAWPFDRDWSITGPKASMGGRQTLGFTAHGGCLLFGL